MKRIVTILFVIGSVFVLSSCQENILTDPQSQETDQAAALLAKKPAAALNCTIQYWLVAPLGEVDSEGRLNVWDATIQGDINGHMEWWFYPQGGPPNLPAEAHVGFYKARWEIWDSPDKNTLMLAGESEGTTAQPQRPVKDGIWRGQGVVTETGLGYEAWMDRHTFEGGNVNWVFPFSGEGIFRIN